MPVYRYQLTGIDVEDLKTQVPPADAPSIVAGSIASVVVWDVTAPATSKDDLDAYFISRGWAFVSQDPVDTPEEASAAQISHADLSDLTTGNPHTQYAMLSASAPVAVTKSAAAVGVDTTAARADHKHDVSTAAAGSAAIGDAAAEGTATSLARSDHNHAFAAPAAPADVTKAAASAGAATTFARADHKHDISTASVSTIQPDDAAAEGTATSLARSDHKHAIVAAAPTQGIGGGNTEGVGTSFSRADHDHKVRETGGPTDLTVGAVADGQVVTRSGTTLIGSTVTTFPGFGVVGDVASIDVGDAASAGVAATAARADHQHALASPAVPADVTKAAASAGASATVARADHKHDVSTAAAVAVGAANAGGSATSLARSDHTHEVTDLKIAGQAQGDILYFNGTNWVRLAPGTSGQHLQTLGAGANPLWSATPLLLDGTRPMTGALQMGDQNITGAKTVTFGSAPDSQTYSSGTLTVDFSAGQKHTVTLNASPGTIAFTAPAGIGNFMLVIKQGTPNTNTMAGWPASVKWSGGVAPTITVGAGKVDVLSFYWDGTNYWGQFALNFA